MAPEVKLSAKDLAEKWARRTKGATADMQKGVARVSTAPGVLAAKQKEKMRAKINEALDNGKWEERVASVTLEDWKKDMTEKGVGRVSAGVDRANGKMENFAGQLIEHQNAGLTKVHALPSLTLSDSGQRMMAWMEHMAKMKYKR